MTRAGGTRRRAQRRPAPTREELTTLLAQIERQRGRGRAPPQPPVRGDLALIQRYGIDASSFRGGSNGDA